MLFRQGERAAFYKLLFPLFARAWDVGYGNEMRFPFPSSFKARLIVSTVHAFRRKRSAIRFDVPGILFFGQRISRVIIRIWYRTRLQGRQETGSTSWETTHAKASRTELFSFLRCSEKTLTITGALWKRSRTHTRMKSTLLQKTSHASWLPHIKTSRVFDSKRLLDCPP